MAAKKKTAKRATKARKTKASATETNSVIDASKYDYTKHDTKTASGRRAVDNDDPVAEALRGKDIDSVKKIATKNKIDFTKWNHLNPGMFRMTVGNALRAKHRRGEASL